MSARGAARKRPREDDNPAARDRTDISTEMAPQEVNVESSGVLRGTGQPEQATAQMSTQQPHCTTSVQQQLNTDNVKLKKRLHERESEISSLLVQMKMLENELAGALKNRGGESLGYSIGRVLLLSKGSDASLRLSSALGRTFLASEPSLLVEKLTHSF